MKRKLKKVPKAQFGMEQWNQMVKAAQPIGAFGNAINTGINTGLDVTNSLISFFNNPQTDIPKTTDQLFSTVAGSKGNYTQTGMFQPNTFAEGGNIPILDNLISERSIAPVGNLEMPAMPQMMVAPQENYQVPMAKADTKVKPNKNAEHAYNYYVNKGLPNHVAAGIVGNLYQESSMNPKITNSIGAFGLAQWLGDRKKNYFDWAAKNKLDPHQMESQLEYVLQEPGESKKMLDAMAKTKTPSEAAYVFANVYERMGQHEANYPRRFGVAEKLYNKKFEKGGVVPKKGPQYNLSPLKDPTAADSSDYRGDYGAASSYIEEGILPYMFNSIRQSTHLNIDKPEIYIRGNNQQEAYKDAAADYIRQHAPKGKQAQYLQILEQYAMGGGLGNTIMAPMAIHMDNLSEKYIEPVMEKVSAVGQYIPGPWSLPLNILNSAYDTKDAAKNNSKGNTSMAAFNAMAAIPNKYSKVLKMIDFADNVNDLTGVVDNMDKKVKKKYDDGGAISPYTTRTRTKGKMVITEDEPNNPFVSAQRPVPDPRMPDFIQPLQIHSRLTDIHPQQVPVKSLPKQPKPSITYDKAYDAKGNINGYIPVPHGYSNNNDFFNDLEKTPTHFGGVPVNRSFDQLAEFYKGVKTTPNPMNWVPNADPNMAGIPRPHQGYAKYAEGGEYEMTEVELKQFLLSGGQVEFL